VLVAMGICASCSGGGGSGADFERAARQAAGLSTVSVTEAGDELRTGWYPDEPGLAPSTVNTSNFGRLFSTAIDGQVYAQPLVWSGTLFVATQTNNVYGLDPVSGSILWTRNLGTAFTSGGQGCADIQPNIGVTSTPVIDRGTGIAYLFSKTAVGTAGTPAWYAHALSVSSGAEQAGFPVLITGTAANDPTQVFAPKHQNQRPALLLLNGVVYAGFGSTCDITPWTGWVAAVSTSGALRTLWVTQAGPNKATGAGIWQAGGGLVSDGDRQILFATGNGGSTAAAMAPGSPPPTTLGESVVRVGVQGDGTLKATDFFAPFDAKVLDNGDLDLGSGGPAGLPSAFFGTPQHPNLLVEMGKQGYVYLLDRDNLGGIGNGPGGGDGVIGRIGSFGGAWSKPAVWPGDGGYVYIPSASGGSSAGGSSGAFHVFHYGLDGAGTPTLSHVAQSTGSFGFGSSSAIVTSNGTQSGSALVWIVFMPVGGGNGAQLRAYDPVPVGGAPNLRFSAAIGTAAKFSPPGAAGNRIYVGTGDGHIIGFGSAGQPLLTGSGFDFGQVTVQTSSTRTLTVTATGNVSVTGVASSNADFALGATTPAIPASLGSGATLQVPITFTPSKAGPDGTTVTITTAQGQFMFAVSGTGQAPTGVIVASPSSVSFGGTEAGGQLVATTTFTNVGGAPVTINTVDVPMSPFGISGAPAPNSVLAPSGGSVTVTLTFSPTVVGSYTGSVGLETTAGTATVTLSGTCTPPGRLTISPLTVNYQVAVGLTQTQSFTVANTGGGPITITLSKPPATGPFVAQTSLPEGTVLAPGTTLTETVAFTPSQVGAASDVWKITADDGSGPQQVTFAGTGVTDLTSSATIIALVTHPAGSGSRNLEVIRDGVYPPAGSTASSQQYDTYTGTTRTEDWIGYQFASPQTFGSMVFQDGMQFHDGGWFATLNLQVRQSGTWVNIPGVIATPAYKGNDGVNFETYKFTFPPITGDAIRLDGQPGGSATFISVGELRVYEAGGSTPSPPVANAGPNQSVAPGSIVTLDGSGSFDPGGGALTYSWTQTSGPMVTLSSGTSPKPTFTAPTMAATLTFGLVVQNATTSSSQSQVTVTVAAPTGGDITANATIIALVTHPAGSGSRNLEVIRDGVFPAVGSGASSQQYDTYTGTTRAEDWIGYQFASPQTFGSVVFQDGIQFHDGGWFVTLNLQVRQSGTWVNVPGVVATPAYKGNDRVNFETYKFTFPSITGDAIRIDGQPGGSATFISVGELRVFAGP
jgi:hypothetical protein